MLTETELLALIEEVQHLRSELDDVEVKTARGGTPQRLFEVLSAFANRPGGGLLLLGLDERRAFEVVGVGDVHRLQEEISHLATADMEPPLRPEFTVAEIAGHTVVVVEVFEIPGEQKPCYYRPAGLPREQQPWLASVWRRADRSWASSGRGDTVSVSKEDKKAGRSPLF